MATFFDARIRYGAWWIEYDPPPIPSRGHDWRYVHDDYDGPGDDRCGTAASPDAAKASIDDLIAGSGN